MRKKLLPFLKAQSLHINCLIYVDLSCNTICGICGSTECDSHGTPKTYQIYRFARL